MRNLVVLVSVLGIGGVGVWKIVAWHASGTRVHHGDTRRVPALIHGPTVSTSSANHLLIRLSTYRDVPSTSHVLGCIILLIIIRVHSIPGSLLLPGLGPVIPICHERENL